GRPVGAAAPPAALHLPNGTRMRSTVLAVLGLAIIPLHAAAQSPVIPRGWEDEVPSLSSLVDFERQQSELRVAVDRFVADRAALNRRYDVDYSREVHERGQRFQSGWEQALAGIDFGS